MIFKSRPLETRHFRQQCLAKVGQNWTSELRAARAELVRLCQKQGRGPDAPGRIGEDVEQALPQLAAAQALDRHERKVAPLHPKGVVKHLGLKWSRTFSPVPSNADLLAKQSCQATVVSHLQRLQGVALLQQHYGPYGPPLSKTQLHKA